MIVTEDVILCWAEERGLLGKTQNPVAQASKTIEEASETLRAVIKGDRAEVIDGIGDVWVTLVILAAQHDTTLIECQQAAWEQIKSRKGKTVNGLFIKEQP